MIRFTGKALEMLHPWRGSDAPIPAGPKKPPTKGKVWTDAKNAWRKKLVAMLPEGSTRPPEAQAHIEALNARCGLRGKAATEVELDPDAQGMAFVILSSKLYKYASERPQSIKLVRDWVVNGGPDLAVRAMVAAWSWSYSCSDRWGAKVAVNGKLERRDQPAMPNLTGLRDAPEWAGLKELRTLLARLPDDEYAQAVATVRELWGTVPPSVKACLIYLVPTEQDLAEQLEDWGSALPALVPLLAWSLRKPAVLVDWCKRYEQWPNEMAWAAIASGSADEVAAALGDDLLHHSLFEAASFVGHPTLATQFVQHLEADATREFFLRFPELALEHLPSDSDLRANVLRMNPDLDPNALPIAGDDEVPELLRVPQKSKKDLPPLWQVYTDLYLVGREKVLAPQHLERLGHALAKSKGRMTPQLKEVRDALDPASRGAFGWALYEAWKTSYYADKWLFRALCVLHDDKVVDQLGAAIMKMNYQEGVTALEVLASTGSERALVRVAHVAAKGRGRGLKNAANNWLGRIAHERGLSQGQLADRLVPTFDLDERGSMELDLGPRTFIVGFDEKLKPFVKSDDGKPRANLPKSKKDDPDKHAAAKKRWSQLKKDVRTIASTQIARFEDSMVRGRRWTQHEFRTYLAGHPLIQHIVRRLVWVVDAADGPVTFRVDEAGAFVDAEDEAIELPEGDVGILHPLDLDDATRAAWGEVLADYEIIQCFPQVGRPTFPPGSTAAKSVLERLDGAKAKGGTVVSLTNRGWSRGGVEDAGQWYEVHYVGPGIRITVSMDHGVNISGGYGFDEDQNLKLDVHTKGKPDPKAYSEGLLGLASLTLI